MPFNRDEEEEDSTFDEVSGMADRLGLKGKQRQAYIDDHMTGLGYEPIQTRQSYVRRQQEQEDQSGGMGARWGFGRGSQQQSGGRSRRDEDDTY